MQSNKMYEAIQLQVKTVIDKLSGVKDDDRLVKEISDAKKHLSVLNEQIQTELSKLKESSEWRKFTIAFYGETNAGKSTLIEALRLHLGEQTKLDSQKKFKDLQGKFGLTQEAFDDVRCAIMNVEAEIEQVQSLVKTVRKRYTEQALKAEMAAEEQKRKAAEEIRVLTEQYNHSMSELDAECAKLNRELKFIRLERTWWQKLISIFSKTPEEKEFIKLKRRALTIEKLKNSELNELETKHREHEHQIRLAISGIKEQEERENLLNVKKEQELKAKLSVVEQQKERLDLDAKKLSEFADGGIIGDGRSDYTRNNTIFDFDLAEREFSLIDVPGIEGDESVVSEPIEEAVRKAHAVFYVTRTARPPQTSDGSGNTKQGTLEKIKKHLSSQTEVWAIYNHPANSPRQLTEPLMNDDDRKSLKAMDEKLKEELQEQYRGSMVVSARPAYLAVTECIIPGSKEAADQRKFIERFSNPETILSLSGMRDFVTRLQTTIVGDCEGKIRLSNLNKAYKTLECSLGDLEVLRERFSSLHKNLLDEISNAASQIDVGVEEFSGSLHALGGKTRRDFCNTVQDIVYKDIEANISNDEFKRSLGKALEREAGNIRGNLERSIAQSAGNLSATVSRIIERSGEHLKNIAMKTGNEFELKDKFDISINVDNGVKLGGLAASGIGAAVGIAFLASNPVGWTVAFVGGALALLASVVGVAKSVWGFFDSNYKKSQQRKEADKVLREVGEKIDREIGEVVAGVEKETKIKIGEVKSKLNDPVEQCYDIVESLSNAFSELSLISRNIITLK